MPNRIIKESITTSDTINNLTPEEECFFYRLITKCDDFGRFDARPAILRAACFPLKIDKVSEEDVQRWLYRLCEVGLVMLYEHEGRPYLQLVTWEKHQQKRAKQSKYPDPNNSTCKHMISDDITCPRETRNENREYEKRETRNDYENRDGEVADDEVVSVWVDMFGSISQPQVAELDEWAVKMDKPLVLEAIKITKQQVDAHKVSGPPFSYAIGILRGWHQKGITNLTELAEYEAAAAQARGHPKKHETPIDRRLRELGVFG